MWRKVAPKGGQNWAKIGEQVNLKSMLDQHGVQEVPKRAPRVDLGSILEARLDLFWSLKSPKGRPKRLQRHAWEPESVQTPIQVPISIDFWSIFELLV